MFDQEIADRACRDGQLRRFTYNPLRGRPVLTGFGTDYLCPLPSLPGPRPLRGACVLHRHGPLRRPVRPGSGACSSSTSATSSGCCLARRSCRRSLRSEDRLPGRDGTTGGSQVRDPCRDTSSISHMNINGNLSSRGLRSFSTSISAMNANFTDSPSQTTPRLSWKVPLHLQPAVLFLKLPQPRPLVGVERLFLDLPRFPRRVHPVRQRSLIDAQIPGNFRYRRPELITSSTASSLYSWVYFLRACPTSGSLLVDHRATSDGVYETGGGPPWLRPMQP